MADVDVLDELGDDLGVRGRLHLVALLLQVSLDVREVGDDAVVDKYEGVVLVGTLRMGVRVSGRAVGGPASVSAPAVRL